MRVVDQEGFDAIECSRCGQCCENVLLSHEHATEPDEEGRVGWWHYRGPLGWLEYYAYWMAERGRVNGFGSAEGDDMLWFGQLEPFQDEEGRWRYRCGHFSRDQEGVGVCGIYEKRPRICEDFPYGKPVSGYDQCTWNVELLDFEVEEGVECR